MKLVKNFDYFQKLSYDVSKPTIIGAIMTILTFASMTILILFNLNDFLRMDLFSTPILYQDKGLPNTQFHINMMVYSPCSLLSIDQEDQNGNRHKNIHENLIKYRHDKNNKLINHVAQENSMENILKQIREEESCNIQGFIKIDKVQGNIQISYHSARMMYNVIANRYPEEFTRLTLSHRWTELKIGNAMNMTYINTYYGYNELTSFSRKDLPDYKYSNKPNYDYFIKLIPFIFTDEQLDLMYYKYSINSQNRKITNEDDDESMPVILLNYDFNYITINVMREKKSIFHFLTETCAIIGGIFFLSSVLSRILISYVEEVKN